MLPCPPLCLLCSSCCSAPLRAVLPRSVLYCPRSVLFFPTSRCSAPLPAALPCPMLLRPAPCCTAPLCSLLRGAPHPCLLLQTTPHCSVCRAALLCAGTPAPSRTALPYAVCPAPCCSPLPCSTMHCPALCCFAALYPTCCAEYATPPCPARGCLPACLLQAWRGVALQGRRLDALHARNSALASLRAWRKHTGQQCRAVRRWAGRVLRAWHVAAIGLARSRWGWGRLVGAMRCVVGGGGGWGRLSGVMRYVVVCVCVWGGSPGWCDD